MGHFALGYIISKATANVIRTKVNIPIIFALSVIPDVDILFPAFLEHRGPAHSLFVFSMVFLPAFAVYHKGAIPYFLALVQHSFPGDFIAGGRTQLLWPLTTDYYGLQIRIESPINVALEWTVFVIAAIVMLKTGDVKTLLTPHNSNLILTIPTATVLLPTILSFPMGVPIILIPPHLFFITLFAIAIIVSAAKLLPQFSMPKKL